MLYLIHFDPPINGTARHYLGSSNSPYSRFAEHLAGDGAAITRWAARNGHRMELVRVWEGGRREERHIKRQHHHARHCPQCRGAASEGMP